MLANHREAFQPEDLSSLGAAFDQVWTLVDSDLAGTDAERKAAARTRLAHIILLLAKATQLDPDEIKRTALQIFQSIEARTTKQTPRRFYARNPAKRPGGHKMATVTQLYEQSSTRTLGRQVVEINRIDSAILTAAKTGVPLPSTHMIFGALSDASIASAEALENCGAALVPVSVRVGLLRLHCSMTDLLTSLGLYTGLVHGLKPTTQFPEPMRRRH